MNIELGEVAEKFRTEEAHEAALKLSDEGVARLLAGAEAVRREPDWGRGTRE